MSETALVSVLAQFNPWWRGEMFPNLPKWRRAAYHELEQWIIKPPAHRATFISGSRQIGKTTLLLQAIYRLLDEGINPGNIIYLTFDHPLVKSCSIDDILTAWREREPSAGDGEIEYIFIDEAQYMSHWGTWIKHQVDFVKKRRIIFTGSATPIIESEQESGVGRWHTIKLSTLSFYEYIQIKQIKLPELPVVGTFKEMFDWPLHQYSRVRENASSYIGHFHEYLLRGGYPQTAQIENISVAQRLLREDIIDKVLKRDMTALFGVRRILELEQAFLYLCMHEGGLLDMVDFCSNLGVKRPTAQSFIHLLEAVNLIYRLQPFGYGKDILRAKYKIYLADAAIAPAVLLKNKTIIDNPELLGVATETAVVKHLFTSVFSQNIRLSYWRGMHDIEVDLVAHSGENLIPFEVKYRAQHTNHRDLKGLLELCQKKQIPYGYVVTKSNEDFGLLQSPTNVSTRLLKIPAAILCYWLGESELRQHLSEISMI